MKTEAELISEMYCSTTLQEDGQSPKKDHFNNTFHIYNTLITNVAFQREWNMKQFL
jgi:hypothetical protein